jgi:hypothetical protein
VPSFGPHSRIAADAGSIGRRNNYELYTSVDMVNNTSASKFKLTIEGHFNNKQYPEPQILTGKSGSAYTTLKPGLISRSATQAVYEVSVDKGQTFRYQLKLNSSNTGAGPVVSAVQMEEVR